MSMSDYVTACCLGKRIVVIDEQKELLRQLKGIGSNINRLTVLANMGKVQVIGLEKAAGEHAGLGFIKGEVCPLGPDLADKSLKVPQMGWNALHIVKDDPLFRYP